MNVSYEGTRDPACAGAPPHRTRSGGVLVSEPPRLTGAQGGAFPTPIPRYLSRGAGPSLGFWPHIEATGAPTLTAPPLPAGPWGSAPDPISKRKKNPGEKPQRF